MRSYSKPITFIFLTLTFYLTLMPLKKEIHRMNICFGGDTMLGRLTNEIIDQTYAAYPWGNIISLLKSSDLNIINLETTLTDSDEIVPKVFNFKATPDKVATLEAGRIDVVNIANNHILDFDESGLIETITTLDDAGIAHVGAGTTIDEARKPVIVTRKGITLGIIGYTDNEPEWLAGKHKPGVNYLKVGNIEQVRKDIAPLKGRVDLIIVSYHWGPNMKEHPSEKHQAFAHAMIDAGVDILHGHSAHIFQGIELYKNKLIMYDTGDLVDDYAVDSKLRNDRSFLFFVSVMKEGEARIHQVHVVPTQINNMQVNRATGSGAAWSIARMQKLSQPFGTKVSADGTVSVPSD